MRYSHDRYSAVSRKDEAKWGDYRTKRAMLEIYDALTEAIHASLLTAVR